MDAPQFTTMASTLAMTCQVEITIRATITTTAHPWETLFVSGAATVPHTPTDLTPNALA